jgi:hypothetical protein
MIFFFVFNNFPSQEVIILGTSNRGRADPNGPWPLSIFKIMQKLLKLKNDIPL